VNLEALKHLTDLMVLIPTTSEELIQKWENDHEWKLQIESLTFPEFRFVDYRPRLIAQELVSVMPMAAPQGIFHYLDYVYAGNTDPIDVSTDG